MNEKKKNMQYFLERYYKMQIKNSLNSIIEMMFEILDKDSTTMKSYLTLIERKIMNIEMFELLYKYIIQYDDEDVLKRLCKRIIESDESDESDEFDESDE